MLIQKRMNQKVVAPLKKKLRARLETISGKPKGFFDEFKPAELDVLAILLTGTTKDSHYSQPWEWMHPKQKWTVETLNEVPVRVWLSYRWVGRTILPKLKARGWLITEAPKKKKDPAFEWPDSKKKKQA
jgi:hypothetical protein